MPFITFETINMGAIMNKCIDGCCGRVEFLVYPVGVPHGDGILEPGVVLSSDLTVQNTGVFSPLEDRLACRIKLETWGEVCRWIYNVFEFKTIFRTYLAPSSKYVLFHMVEQGNTYVRRNDSDPFNPEDSQPFIVGVLREGAAVGVGVAFRIEVVGADPESL